MADIIQEGLSLLEGEIPGLAVIGEVIDQLDAMAKEVTKFATEIGSGHGHAVITELLKSAGKATKGLEKLPTLAWRDISTYGTGTLFKSFLEAALGLNYGEMSTEARGSIDTIDTMLTFATVFPLSITAVDAVLSFFLGQRAPRLAESVLGRLSEELGLTWAMGMTIDRAFETAIGNRLEESILYQKRPVVPEWQIIRAMLKQHLVDEHTLRDRAAHMGFSNDWVERIVGLSDAQIPVGDLQQLYLHDMLDADKLDPYLEALGFSAPDRKLLSTLYIDKAETTAGSYLRNVARAAFEKDLIAVGDYEQIQVDTNMPSREIADDLRAIAMEKTLGRLLTPVSALKTQYQHGDLHDDTVTPLLRQLGYTDDAIGQLLAAWREPKLPHPMSAAKVLTYWYSGVLTDRADAEGRLLATGLRPQDADFLLDHPPAGGARKHALTTALVTQAYLDGVLTQDQLDGAYARAGATGDVASYLKGVAMFRHSRQKRPAEATIPLTAGQVLDAFKVGVYDPQLSISELEKLGYSPEDALTLLEIKNKGENPLLKGGAPAFPNLEAAIAYLEAHGFAVHPPPDPQLTAAEQMVLQAGWTYTSAGEGISTVPQTPVPPGSAGGGPTLPGGLPGPFPVP